MTHHPATADGTPGGVPARAIDAVLYDFGNVLVGWDPYGAYAGLDREVVDAFFADVDFRVLNHERDAGATWADARAAVETSHPHHVAPASRSWLRTRKSTSAKNASTTSRSSPA